MTALVVTSRRFNGYEFWKPLQTIIRRGHSLGVYSTSDVLEDEKTGKKVRCSGTLVDIDPEKYNSLMIISGNPSDTEKYWYDPTIKYLVQFFNKSNLPIAGICASVPSVRWALAPGAKVAVFPMQKTHNCLKEVGVLPAGVTMTVVGNVVTAENEMLAEPWAEAFCDLMEGKVPTVALQPVGEIRHLRERRRVW